MTRHKLSGYEYLLYSAVIALGIFADQLTKRLAEVYLRPVGSIGVIPGLFAFTYVENRGAAWGMFASSPWVFLVVSSVAILALVPFLFLGFAEHKLSRVALALIVSGGVGNMINRIAVAYVVDFIHFLPIDFPVFNTADCLVCIGGGLLVLSLLLDLCAERRRGKEKKENGTDGTKEGDA